MTWQSGDARREPAAVLWRPLCAVLGVLAVSNVVVNTVLPPWVYVPWNLAVAWLVLMLALGRRGQLGLGVQLADLGFARATLRRSAIVGGLGIAAFIVVYAIGVALPFTRAAFDDSRVQSSAWLIAFHALIHIPLGTVVLEELAFRGALPALLGLRGANQWQWRPILIAAGFFGLWHLLPAAKVINQNSAVHDLVGGWGILGILGAMAAAAVAGLLLSFARWVGRGLLTPILFHIGTNSVALIFAWLVSR